MNISLNVKINNRFFCQSRDVTGGGLHLENFWGEWRVRVGVTTHISVTVSVTLVL